MHPKTGQWFTPRDSGNGTKNLQCPTCRRFDTIARTFEVFEGDKGRQLQQALNDTQKALEDAQRSYQHHRYMNENPGILGHMFGHSHAHYASQFSEECTRLHERMRNLEKQVICHYHCECRYCKYTWDRKTFFTPDNEIMPLSSGHAGFVSRVCPECKGSKTTFSLALESHQSCDVCSGLGHIYLPCATCNA